MMLNSSGRGHWKDTAEEGFELAASRMCPWSQQARQLGVHCCIKAGFSNIAPVITQLPQEHKQSASTEAPPISSIL